MNVLAVVAHPDDEILGCGATLRRLADAGHSVFSCILCSAAAERFNQTVVGFLRDGRFNIYTHPQRIELDGASPR